MVSRVLENAKRLFGLVRIASNGEFRNLHRAETMGFYSTALRIKMLIVLLCTKWFCIHITYAKRIIYMTCTTRIERDHRRTENGEPYRTGCNNGTCATRHGTSYATGCAKKTSRYNNNE